MPAYPQVSGLTMLGEALAGGSRDYANRKLSLEDEARRRGEHLQDVASQRDYEDRTYRGHRADALADVTSGRIYEDQRYKDRLQDQAQQDIVLGLVHEGLLAPADLGNAQAVSKAFEVARVRGLDKLYNDLLNTPGPSGKPLLSRADLANPQAIEAAKSAYAQIQATSKKLSMDQPQNAVTALGDLTREAQQVRARLAQVEAKLGETTPTVNQTEVMNRALQLARDANGGKPPSQQQIQSMVTQAQQEASQLALQRWYQDKEDAKIQYQILNARLNNLRQAQSDLTKTFGVAPRANVMSEPTISGPQDFRPAEASPEQRQAALTAAVRSAVGPQNSAPAVAPGLAPSLPNPVNDPMVEAENQRISQRNLTTQNSQLADPYNQALDDLHSVSGQITAARSGQRPGMAGLYSGGIEVGPYAGPSNNPMSGSEQAAYLSDLLIKQQAIQRNVEAKRRAMLGLPADVTAPTISTAAGSTPAAYSRPDNWWKVGD